MSSFKTLLEMTPEQIRERFGPDHRDCKCGNRIQTTPPNTIDGVPTCDDCYFEEFGKLVEEHPIGAPRRRRGWNK